jgi:parallel beta-helix repeat protein
VIRRLGSSFVAAIAVALLPTRGGAVTLTVANVNDSGAGSLRQAILDANVDSGLDTIVFQIPGGGTHTIALLTALPTIAYPVVIDGTTQPGYAGTPVIELNGNSLLNVDGFRVPAGNCTIRGLAINRFGGAGIHLQAPGGTNFIQGNFIGTDTTGTLNRGNGQSTTQSGGLWVDGSSGNWIGGTNATNRNLISGNRGTGVYLQFSSGNTIQGNLIGVSLAGTDALGNSNNGISIYNSASNLIGGTLPAARNVISANASSGVYLYGPGATANWVQGNYIGTDANGALALGNAGDGLTVQNAAANEIGGEVAGAGNLIAGNRQGGVTLNGAGTFANRVQGNLIGLDASGRLALGNAFSGITIFAASSNLIGGTVVAARNVVSANLLSGIYLTTNSSWNLVQGNFVGVDTTGSKALGNGVNGISIDSSSSNVVGGSAAGARNIISGNSNHGVEIFIASAKANKIEGNYIGPDVTGQSALGNKLSGIHVLSAANIIGGVLTGEGNLISGNGENGIFLDGLAASGNLVQGNFVGTSASGTSRLGNGRSGVGISGAPGNTIGGADPGAGNLISGNGIPSTEGGMFLMGGSATGNVIQGNKIGTDVTGTLPLGNTHEGIYLESAASNTIGGVAPGAGNLISANSTWGIYLVAANGNVIQGNLIGTKSDGVTGLGNTFHALECSGSSNNTIGGSEVGAGNRIGFSQTVYAGVRIRNGSTSDAVLGNAIFSNGGLSIDLGTYGVNANVPCDSGTGDNMLQNYPVLTQAVSGGGTGIRGTLNSRPNRAFVLQFFANPTCDPSGFGAGLIFLGQQSVVTSNDCNTSFMASFPTSVPVGYVITATATDSANNTSEFSACVPAGPLPGLSISTAANHQVALAWTNTTTGFALKQTASLTPPIQWEAVTNIPVAINGQFVVTLPANVGNRFYALRFE